MAKTPGEKLVAKNPTAFQDYFIQEVVEAGMVLTGTEIKSLRTQAPSLKDAHVDVTRGAGVLEAWLVGAHIAPYQHGNIWNHEPTRRRKLLLHRHQIEKLHGAITQKGVTLIPTRLYLKGGRAKIEVALATRKKKHDKRAESQKRTHDREIDLARKRSR